MASNLTVTASAQTNRSTPSVSMGADAAAQPFAKVLEREVNTRQEGQPDSAEQKSSASTNKDEHEAGTEEQSAAASAQAIQPWLAMLQAQAVVAQVTPLVADAKTDVSSDVSGDLAMLDLSKMGKGLLGDGELKDGKDLSDLDQLGLKPENALAGSIDTAKFASLRQKAAGAGEFAAPADDFSALLANSKENVLLPKIEATPQVALRTPVVEAKPALPQHTVTEAVGSSRWGDAVAQRVSMMLQDQHQQIDMQLNPPHLGPMEVRLTMSGEQASVVFSSQHASVREALAAATPRLTMLLADQGIQLSNVQVASDSLNQHAQQQAQQQASSQQMNQQRQSRAQQFVGDLNGAYADGQPRVMTDVHLPVARSGLNLYV